LLCTYSTSWLPPYYNLLLSGFLKFAIDDQEIGRITPAEGGFWEVGEFNSTIGTADNPWKYGTQMAPFDKEVS
jgi:hypothetical protein